MKVERGKLQKPYGIMVYGTEGAGKTTLAAQAEAPIFLCAEEGTDELDVARARCDDGTPLQSYEDACDVIDWLTNNTHDFKTLVIDTVDWLHQWIEQYVCRSNDWDNIESPGYGKGHVIAAEQWRLFLARLETLQSTKKMHILLLGHAHIKRYTPPDADPYDRFALKMPDKSASLLKEWCKAVLFARFDVSVVKDDKKDKKGRAFGNGKRILITEETPSVQAKNRFGLPPVIQLNANTFQVIEQYRTGKTADFEGKFAELMRGHAEEAQARDWFAQQADKAAALEKIRARLAQEAKAS